MFLKVLVGFTIILNLLSCKADLKFSKTRNPTLLVSKIHLAFVSNGSRQLDDLMIDRETLIIALTEDDNKKVYAYDAQLFSMATDEKTFKVYKKRLYESFHTIKKKHLNWKKISIQKATYQTDSLQISLKGLLLVKDNQNKRDSIHFKGVKLLDVWVLTEIY